MSKPKMINQYLRSGYYEIQTVNPKSKVMSTARVVVYWDEETQRFLYSVSYKDTPTSFIRRVFTLVDEDILRANGIIVPNDHKTKRKPNGNK
jgi:hypothetical protein